MEKTSVGVQAKLLEAQSLSILSRSSEYATKAKEIGFSMAPVSYQNSLRVNINCQNKWTYIICQGVKSPPFGPLGYVSYPSKSIRDTFRGLGAAPNTYIQ